MLTFGSPEEFKEPKPLDSTDFHSFINTHTGDRGSETLDL